MFPNDIPVAICDLIQEYACEKKEHAKAFEISEQIQNLHPVHLNNFSNYPNHSINRVFARWGYGTKDMNFILKIHLFLVRASRLCDEYAVHYDLVFTEKSLLEDLIPKDQKQIFFCVGDIVEVVCKACDLMSTYGFIYDYMISEYFCHTGKINVIDFEAFQFQLKLWERRPEFIRGLFDFTFVMPKASWVRYDTGEVCLWEKWVKWRKTL